MSKHSESHYAGLREEMVRAQLEARNITDEAVIAAIRKVPRHLFVPEEHRAEAYDDKPIPIAEGSTISQPYIVALMLESLRITSHDKVLEVGTGSGYQTALLCELAQQVYSVEINEKLIPSATKLLADSGYRNFFLRSGDGYQGWKRRAPFDVIVVSAACEEVPRDLTRQLGDYGRMVFPLDGDPQFLILLEKNGDELTSTELCPVRFVPMRSQGGGGEN